MPKHIPIVQRLNDIVREDGRAQGVIAVEIGISHTKLREALVGIWPKQYEKKQRLETWINNKEGK